MYSYSIVKFELVLDSETSTTDFGNHLMKLEAHKGILKERIGIYDDKNSYD